MKAAKRRRRPVLYEGCLPVTGRCNCGDECTANRYAREYFMVVFNIGDDKEVTWWLSRS